LIGILGTNMELVRKKILVTGGAGFIGSHLADALVTDNQVTVVDNLSTGKIENIQPHLKSGAINFIQADITDLDRMRELVPGNQVIFHLAVQGLRLSLSDPYSVHEVNATGTLNMCQAAYEAGIERFIYISSSEVYGTAQTVPMTEEHPLAPTTPYGASKLAGEAYARAYYLSFGLPVAIVRPFNTYGPREHLEGVYGEVIPRFVLRVMNGLPPVIFGDGHQTRDFTSVKDIVRGILAVCQCEDLIGDTVNIAAGREVSINEIARLILQTLERDREIEPVHIAPRPGDVRRHYADTSKARRFLGFQPEIDIEEGIRHYISWFKEQDWDLQNLQQQEVICNWRRQ
jgi:UDP-glucose 4-epimerase